MKDKIQNISLSIKALNSYTGRDSEYHDYRIVNFLYEFLGPYADPKEDILKCLDYVYAKHEGKGGFILLGIHEEEIVGCLVINETGMTGYIPENVLVYLAVNPKYRKFDVGKRLVEHSKKIAKGNIALHVEPDNPSIKLYEELGFMNKCVEMRLER